jgi:hypothetical protein
MSRPATNFRRVRPLLSGAARFGVFRALVVLVLAFGLVFPTAAPARADSGVTVKISKYQLQYRAQGSDMVKSKSVSAKKLKATVKGLKKGKRYEVRIRSCKTVKGVRHYSLAQRWVTTKKVK